MEYRGGLLVGRVLLVIWLILFSPILQAIDQDSSFDDFSYHASLWQNGWTSFFAGSLALQGLIFPRSQRLLRGHVGRRQSPRR